MAHLLAASGIDPPHVPAIRECDHSRITELGPGNQDGRFLVEVFGPEIDAGAGVNAGVEMRHTTLLAGRLFAKFLQRHRATVGVASTGVRI